MTERLVMGACLVLVILVAGIVGLGGGVLTSVSDGEATPTESRQTEPRGGEPYRTATVSVELADYDQWPATDESVDVEVRARARGYDALSYDGLRLCAYDENGTVLFGETLGPLRSPDSGEFARTYEVEMSTATTPAYVTVDHPGLRNDSRVAVDVLTWDEEMERLDQRTSDHRQPLAELFDDLQDEFAFPRSSRVGQCG